MNTDNKCQPQAQRFAGSIAGSDGQALGDIVQGDADAEQRSHFLKTALLVLFCIVVAVGQQLVQQQKDSDAADKAEQAVKETAVLDRFG